jgi:hypothetical protein
MGKYYSQHVEITTSQTGVFIDFTINLLEPNDIQNSNAKIFKEDG